jgi:hypothetical protein
MVMSVFGPAAAGAQQNAGPEAQQDSGGAAAATAVAQVA